MDGMSDTLITDDERQLLVLLVTRAWLEIRDDSYMRQESAELEVLLRKINGVDKVLTVR
jgi:hypothetical protein